MAPAYAWHRRFLQHLQSGHHGERWLLKSPAHLWSLPALLAEYPDAIVIQNHRDPLKVIASISALGASLREMTSDSFDVTRLAIDVDEWDARISGGPGNGRGSRSVDRIDDDGVDAVCDEILHLA